MARINPNLAATTPPPVMEARRWLDAATFPDHRPLINVSQAAPVDAPPPDMRAAMAEMIVSDDSAHIYGPVLGLPDLRDAVAAKWGVLGSQVAITSGCNQAFAATISTLAVEGDEVILPTPWYFNHKMWLDMSGVRCVGLPTGDALIPKAEDAAKKITDKTRAIVLVTPNNPTGIEYPAETLRDFADLCRDRQITLILDETYRDFDSRSGPAHDLLDHPDWADTVVTLYSFSKAYRLTGHRVGAMIASETRLAEAEKFLDTVTICPNQLGQRAALWGMQNLDAWLGDQRREILSRAQAIRDHAHKLQDQGWHLQGCGAYFAYLHHPFDMASDDLAKMLVTDHSILCLPGTMFMPNTDRAGKRAIRVAFANIDCTGIATLMDRLANVKT